jgi:hypothetical protein
MKDLMVIGGNAPRSPCVSMYFFRSLSIYSKTSMSLFSVWMTSCRLTMFSCFNSFINEISRIAVEGVPSSESRWISFSATSSPVCLFRPLKTWASQHNPIRLRARSEEQKALCIAAPLRSSNVHHHIIAQTYRSICTLTQLLQLLERTRMSLVHGCRRFLLVEIL